MRPTTLLLFAAAASPVYSSVLAPIEALRQAFQPLQPRQNNANNANTSPSPTSFDLNFTGVQGNTATTQPTSSAASTSGGDTKNSGSDKPTSTGKDDNKKTSSGGNNQQSTKTFDPRLPAGGVQMVTPAPTAQASYYKINNPVTFAWNYTSLSVTPSAVDVLASCSVNNQIYTIAANMSVTNATQSVTWDTAALQTKGVSLITETYTLIIHDASQEMSATAKSGYLATFNQFTFGMYQPQPYTPIAQWTCVTCSGALSAMERQTLGFVVIMASLTVLSFGWFGNIAGLL